LVLGHDKHLLESNEIKSLVENFKNITLPISLAITFATTPKKPSSPFHDYLIVNP
jgi:hypothetical protein